MRLRSDLLDVLDAATRGELEDVTIEWDPRAALCVVMAAEGYPGEVKKGAAIEGLPSAMGDDLAVFHAGTRRVGGRVITNGGRVLGVTALGDTLGAARRRAYEAIAGISFEGMQYRDDLGQE
jgi:phosphoribosylamine--glycine ligase